MTTHGERVDAGMSAMLVLALVVIVIVLLWAVHVKVGLLYVATIFGMIVGGIAAFVGFAYVFGFVALDLAPRIGRWLR